MIVESDVTDVSRLINEMRQAHNAYAYASNLTAKSAADASFTALAQEFESKKSDMDADDQRLLNDWKESDEWQLRYGSW